MPSQQQCIRRASLALFSLGLVACGGGSSDSPPAAVQKPSLWDQPIALQFERVLSAPSQTIATVAENDFVDVSINRTSTVATIVQNQRVYLSDDLGRTWRDCPITPETGNLLTTVAISPNGQRVFVGGTFGRFFTLATADCAQERGGQVNNDVLGNYLFEIKQAVWYDNQRVVVAMNNNSSTQRDGLLARGHIPVSTINRVIWEDLKPARIQNSNLSQPVAAQSVDINTTRMIVAGVHRISGNSRSNPEIVQSSPADDRDWGQTQLPQAFMGQVPKSLATTGSVNDVVLYLLDARPTQKASLWLTRFGTNAAVAATAFPVQTTGLPDLDTVWHAAKVDQERRVWLATNRGLYRSQNMLPRAND